MHNLNDPSYVFPFVSNETMAWKVENSLKRDQFFPIKPFSQLMKQQISIQPSQPIVWHDIILLNLFKIIVN